MAADAFIHCRVTSEVKALVRRLAERDGINESTLVKQLLDVLLRTQALADLSAPAESDKVNRGARLYVRLAAEDGRLLKERSSARGLPSALGPADRGTASGDASTARPTNPARRHPPASRRQTRRRWSRRSSHQSRSIYLPSAPRVTCSHRSSVAHATSVRGLYGTARGLLQCCDLRLQYGDTALELLDHLLQLLWTLLAHVRFS
jgi:antitoxin component of RelBE/YafQ-DinJ toxin-antitoxin module